MQGERRSKSLPHPVLKFIVPNLYSECINDKGTLC